MPWRKSTALDSSEKKKDIFLKYIKEEPNSENLIQLKEELEEARKVEDILLRQIKDKHQEQEKLEEVVVCLRKKLENTQRELSMNTPRMKSSEQFEKIINAEICPLIKTRLGYEGEKSNSKVEDNRNITFVKAVRDNEEDKKFPTEVEVSKNMTCKETNRNKQQHERIENERKKQSTAKGSYAPMDELKILENVKGGSFLL